MLIIIADVSLKHTDVNINLVLFWTSISYKEYRNNFKFCLSYVIHPINDQNLLSKSNYKVCKVALVLNFSQ